MTSMIDRLVSQEVFAGDQVSLSLWSPPPMSIPSIAYAQVEPRGGGHVDPMVEGSGRFASGQTTFFGVNVYVQNAGDPIYADTQRLVGEGALYPTIEAVVAALHLWEPLDPYGRPLTIEPMRLVRVTAPQDYPHSREWVYATAVFEATSKMAIESHTYLPC